MIHLSQAAISEILRLKARRNDPKLLFRLGIQSGSCMPLLYTLTFVPSTQPDDQVYDCNGVQVVVDANSLAVLDGLVVDYSEDLMGGGFRFHNPNAVQSCGCGNSFEAATTARS